MELSEKIGVGRVTTVTPMLVNYKDCSWRMAIGMALGYLFLPLLIVLSKVLKKEIEFMKYKIL